MENNKFAKYQYDNDLREGFVPIQSNVMIKTILISLLYYIVSNVFVYNFLKTKLPRSVDTNLIQALIFALFFYLITVNI